MKETRYINSWRRHFLVHWSFLLVILWFVIVNILSDFRPGVWIWTGIAILSLFISILIHDSAHVLTGRLFKIQISWVVLLPIGALPSISEKPARKISEIIMLLSGPLANLLVAGFLVIFLRPYEAYWNEPKNIGVAYPGNLLFQFQLINLSLGLLNLLPAFPMDGGLVLDTLLENRYSTLKSKQIVKVTSLLIAFGFLLAGLVYLNYVLILIGLFIGVTVYTGKYYHPLRKVNMHLA